MAPQAHLNRLLASSLLLLTSSLANPITSGPEPLDPSSVAGNATVRTNWLETCAPVASRPNQSMQPDLCYRVKDSAFRAMEVLSPWPTCANGSLALYAEFDANNGICDPILNENGQMYPLLDKGHLINRCTNLVSTGSFAFWCDGYVPRRLRPDEPAEPEPEPAPKPPKSQAKRAGMRVYPDAKCHAGRAPFWYPSDKCFDMRDGLQILNSAVCENGTEALVARFRGKGCDPTNNPLADALSSFENVGLNKCLDTTDIGSLAFWCDGVEGVDMGKSRTKPSKGGSKLGLILGLGLGIPLAIVAGLFVAFNLHYGFRTRVKEMFGSEGGIAL